MTIRVTNLEFQKRKEPSHKEVDQPIDKIICFFRRRQRDSSKERQDLHKVDWVHCYRHQRVYILYIYEQQEAYKIINDIMFELPFNHVPLQSVSGVRIALLSFERAVKQNTQPTMNPVSQTQISDSSIHIQRWKSHLHSAAFGLDRGTIVVWLQVTSPYQNPECFFC